MPVALYILHGVLELGAERLQMLPAYSTSLP